jgi:hypothetical protein
MPTPSKSARGEGHRDQLRRSPLAARRRLDVFVVLLAVVATLAIAVPAAAAEAGTVSGVVSLPPGALSGQVTLVSGGEPLATTEIGADGSYSVDAEPGTYSLWFEGSFAGPSERAVGSWRVTRNGVEVSAAGVDLDVDVPIEPLAVTVVDTRGAAVPAVATLDCVQEVSTTSDRTSMTIMAGSGNGELAVYGFPVDEELGDGSGCTLAVDTDYRAQERRAVVIRAGEDNQVTVEVPVVAMVTGTVSAPGGPATSGEVVAYDQSGQKADSAPLQAGGTYELGLRLGTYDFRLTATSSGRRMPTWVADVVVDDDTTLDGPASVPVLVHLVEEDGTPAAADLFVECSQPPATSAGSFYAGASGTGEVVLPALPTSGGWQCQLGQVQLDSNDYFGRLTIRATDNELTLVVPTGSFFEGGLGSTGDADGVTDLVEALGPNGGDGNGDDVPDREQANVTSLPANGGSPGGAYVTVAGPAGSSLVDVSTMDLAGAPPPPADVTLPAGLTSFVLTGITPGSDQTVSIYMGAIDGVNGYAKYDPGTSTWSLLPGSRVQVVGNHVDITLTDGGVGDDDGVVNGAIADPGGFARIAGGDRTPPVVRGWPTRPPNGHGWYSGDVRIHWKATDPGSGVASSPRDTLVRGEGNDLTAQSGLVCDRASPPNCARGEVTGLKIDRTAPALRITGVTRGATYRLGAVPEPRCAASDALSGLARSCTGAVAGGDRAGVGTFTYVAAATDRAGNLRVVRATYRVVRR